MIELEFDTQAGLRMLNAQEALHLGLPALTHGLILLSEDDGPQWSLATADLDLFAMIAGAQLSGDTALITVVLQSAGPAWRLILGWPDENVGTTPEPPKAERN